MREMYDCIGIDAGLLRSTFPNAEMVAFYTTGTPEIVWSDADKNQFPGAVLVSIDQGFNSPTVTKSIVRDVESGAWTAAAAVVRSNWDTDRPTIYCSMDTLHTAILPAGWKGDLWLAIPGHTGPPPVIPGCNVVAIQDTWGNWYDRSTVYDDTWPNKVTTTKTEQEMISNSVNMGTNAYVPFPAGSFKAVHLFKDFGDATLRLAVHSFAHGYTQIVETVEVAGNKSMTVTFKETDVDGVSISQVSAGPVGYTIA